MADEKPKKAKATKAKKSGGAKKAKAKPKKAAAKKSTAKKPAKKASKAKPKKAASSKAATKKAPPKKAASKRGSSLPTAGLDKSIAQFRDSLEQSVTLSLDRIQEVVDDAVKRGRITRGDSEKMIGELVKRGRKQTDALLSELEKLARAARRKLP